jgi:hypothetical protein
MQMAGAAVNGKTILLFYGLSVVGGVGVYVAPAAYTTALANLPTIAEFASGVGIPEFPTTVAGSVGYGGAWIYNAHNPNPW